MQLRRFKALGITSSRLPENTHLFNETNSSGTIYMVDSVDETLLVKTTDKGDNWSTIKDVSATAEDIQAMWHNRATEELWFVSCPNGLAGAGTQIHVWKVDLTNDTVTEEAELDFGNDGTYLVFDIFFMDSKYWILDFRQEPGPPSAYSLQVREVNTAGDTLDLTDSIAYGVIAGDAKASPAVVISSDAYFYLHELAGGTYSIIKFDGANFSVEESLSSAYQVPTAINRRGITYDGTSILQFLLRKVADGKFYLISYIIGGVETYGAEHDVSLMMDRNNIATIPNELEKAFGISNEIIYEIKTRRGGIIQLQDISAVADNNIIAITDNFIMISGGPMFEFQDVTSEISTTSYNDGIMGILKKGVFTIHPDFENRWSKGDSIKFYDQYDQLEFWGKIIDKNRNRRGIYVIKIDSFTNEVLRKTYSTTYSGNDTDTKQKDIIDNALDLCYRSSSIVGTTTTYDYDYNRAVIYLFWFARRLERQVPYIEPDGKIWTKLYSALSPNDLIYPGTYNFKDDTVGGNPSGWTLDEGGGTINIIASIDGHRNVVELDDTDGADNVTMIHTTSTGQTIHTVEFYLEGNDVTDVLNIRLRDISDTDGVAINIDTDKIQYHNGVGWNDIAGGGLSDDTLYHMRIDFNCTADTFDFYLDGTLIGDDLAFRNDIANVRKIYFGTINADSNYKYYLDAIGFSWDPAYTVGDNEVAWDLNNHWQNIRFVDIPGLEEIIQGFFDGNTGITRNTIRYRDNTPTIRPIAATRDPIEQLKGILPLEEFRDPKVEASTEAEQLGDNRYAIWAADTIFLGLYIEGQGYLQPGKTVHIENTGQITVAESNLLLLSFTRDPKNNVYRTLILSDNIIFPSEFTNLDNTSPQQIHTATVQSFENQADIIAHLTPEGGLALRLTNKTGVASVKGTIIEAHGATDNAFRVCDASSVEPFGIVYENGKADGAECLVVIGGRTRVLLKDATASTRNFWAGVSDVAGRADCTGASPPAAPAHFKEIGHCIESQGAGVDVLSYIMVHFL